MNKSVREILDLSLAKIIAIVVGRVAKTVYRYLYFVLMRPFYGRLDQSCFISPFASIRGHGQIFVGNNAVINRNSVIWGQLISGRNLQLNPGACIYGKVTVGDNVMIAPNVVIVGGNHGIERNGVPMCDQPCTSKGVKVNNDVWVGANAVILDGVIVGEGAVIAAGAVVNRNVDAFSIVAGIPAKKIKLRT